MTKRDYPYIRTYCAIMGSNQSWMEQTLAEARRDNAPGDVWTWTNDDPGNPKTKRVWLRVSDLKNQTFKKRIMQAARDFELV